MGFKITTIHAFIAMGEDGEEGIIGKQIAGTFMPFVCADEKRVKILKPHAVQIARTSKKKVTLAKFSVREDLEVLE